MYYLKYYDKVIAEITVENDVPVLMEILNPKYFFDKYSKNVLDKHEIQEWIKDRVRPDTQAGFSSIAKSLGIHLDDSMWYWDLFKSTKGLNVKDKLYLTEDELSESPWDSILIDTNTNTHYKDLFTINYTNNNINMIGACSKKLIRMNGKLGILKKSLQHNTYDSVCEELIFKIAEQIGISCSPAICLSSDESVSFIDENIDLIHGEVFLNTTECDIEIMYTRLRKTNVDKRVLVDFLRMFLFDILTRQMDRNVTNFGFYRINDYIKLYRLYDNGLSLFSSVSYKESLSYVTLYGESLTNIKYLARELKRLGVDEPFPSEINKEFLLSIIKPFESVIADKKPDNNIDDICNWVMKMYQHIKSEFNQLILTGNK
ncbi:hypothetical protein [Cetobacterium sp.]|uniref:hypothetical protein n=1 Tax=Cetobacterium sp. TaxID=2071632 RepID=UPI003F30F4F2